MSNFDLTREREVLTRRWMAGELADGEYAERLDEIYNDYREVLQRARQEDTTDPESESPEDYYETYE